MSTVTSQNVAKAKQAIEHCKQKGKKVAIIGKAANSQMLAPFEDESWEVWGLSNAYQEIPRWDVWFELHDWEYHRRNNMEHYQWLLKDHGKPIYAFENRYHNAPNAVKFPLQDIMKMFGPYFNGQDEFRYWTNSPSYMMALAMWQGATTIGLWGIDMAMSDEYAVQRPSCELMIGAAIAREINVVIPPESSLCKCRRLYGYETHNSDGYVEVRTRENVLKERLAKADMAAAESSAHLQMFHGALREVELYQQDPSKYDPEERKKMLAEGINASQKNLDMHEKQKHIFQGALEDLSWVKTVFLT